MDTPTHYIMTVACPAASGIVAAVTSFLSTHECYISELAQFDDEAIGRFFLRARFRFNNDAKGDPAENVERMQQEFNQVASDFSMEWQIHDAAKPPKVMIMVSKFDHCLTDLLYRHRKGELPMEITAIVSNHLDLRPMAEREGIRFVYKPITPDTKAQREQELFELIEDTGTELVVLARYMQILSDDMCRKLEGRAINIHHSFLPGFKGARPYHQAFERGVKLIGATAHFVTADLDEGPIIEQEVQRVDHTYRAQELASVGRATETVALSRAVRYFLEHRIFLADNKTVIFH
ncbi:formyltetrahydrofolate deformylase [Larsenimonas suaedae]|uniref:Formyltetrahydrofolate deformylase n=1 Tax=Larsenimonas suaedae TaxID=1851019 RepID=A0ABU1GRW1_9GAMM|nr:formyltetrahydrofolate deformylase [Larsenimonas suaedae]MCM2972623.1 formyltetrahydrofolate deformylase [Larsenimonas suaedae]MDR5894580.1 formyltetrahydrofolate deformylase [Larsenimonas suaedae]